MATVEHSQAQYDRRSPTNGKVSVVEGTSTIPDSRPRLGATGVWAARIAALKHPCMTPSMSLALSCFSQFHV
jgi:hypothetical protein